MNVKIDASTVGNEVNCTVLALVKARCHKDMETIRIEKEEAQNRSYSNSPLYIKISKISKLSSFCALCLILILVLILCILTLFFSKLVYNSMLLDRANFIGNIPFVERGNIYICVYVCDFVLKNAHVSIYASKRYL